MRAFNVLVIDDDPSIRHLLEKLLADRPRYRALIAGSGQAALKCLTEERVDVVLSDIYMPGFSGLELLKDMQRVNIRPQIVIMTANATPENVESARAIGARSMLIKPFDDLTVVEDEIEKAVREVEARGDAPVPPPMPRQPGPPAFGNAPSAVQPSAPRPPAPRPSAPAPLPPWSPKEMAADEVESPLDSESSEAVEIDADASPAAWTDLSPSGEDDESPASAPEPETAAADDPFPAADGDSLAAADSVTIVDEEAPVMEEEAPVEAGQVVVEDEQPAAVKDEGPAEEVNFSIVDEGSPPALPDFDAWKSAPPTVPVSIAPAPREPARAIGPAPAIEVPPRPARTPGPQVVDLLMLPIEVAPEESGRPGAAFDQPDAPGPAAPGPARKPASSPIDFSPVEDTRQEPEATSNSWLEPPPEIKEWAEPADETTAWAEPAPEIAVRPDVKKARVPAEGPKKVVPAPPSPAGTADIPEELAEILRMDMILDIEKMKIQVPIICLQTWEEETAVASLRAVSVSIKREFHCWSAASGIVRDGGAPMGDAYRDPTRALEFIRRQKRRALYFLADFRHYLEDPAVVRVLREMVMARETVLAMLVLTAPRLTIPPELARVTAAFEWPAFDGDVLRAIFDEIRKEIEASSGRRIQVDPEESEALLSVMVEMPLARARFEISRALTALMNRA